MDIDKVKNTISNFEIPELLIMAGAGLALTLFGYRIKKIAFFVIWFILGYNLMGLLMPTIETAVPQIVGNDLYQILLPIAGGLLLALLGFSIEKFCVGGICFALIMIITAQQFGTEMQTLAIGAVVAIIAAGAAVMLIKPATIIATSAVGAYALMEAIVALTSFEANTYYWPLFLGITAIGAIFQFVTTKRID